MPLASGGDELQCSEITDRLRLAKPDLAKSTRTNRPDQAVSIERFTGVEHLI
jgi:hypothetical protein